MFRTAKPKLMADWHMMEAREKESGQLKSRRSSTWRRLVGSNLVKINAWTGNPLPHSHGAWHFETQMQGHAWNGNQSVDRGITAMLDGAAAVCSIGRNSYFLHASA